MRTFSLDCLTFPQLTPAQLIRVAAETGYGVISLWVQPPALFEPMLAEPADRAEIAAALADSGMRIGNLEVFNLNTDEPIAAYEARLAHGASLGASSATAINFGAPREDIPERLARFHGLCTALGLQTFVEPISMGLTRTAADAVALIRQAGVDAQIVIDMLHLVRTGGSPETLAAIPPAMIGHVQVCDGPLVVTDDRIGIEATADRMYPGEGEFPLAALLASIPDHASVGLEAPNLDRLERGVDPLVSAREGLLALRRLLPGKDA